VTADHFKPEQLVTRPIQVVSLSLAVLGLGFLAWGFFGTLRTEVQGTGLVIRGQRLVSVTSPQQGLIKALAFRVNQTVQKGAVLASLDTQQQAIQAKAAEQILLYASPRTQASNQATQEMVAIALQQLNEAKQAMASQGPILQRRIGQQHKTYIATQAMLRQGLASSDEVAQAFDEWLNLKTEWQQLQATLRSQQVAYQQAVQQNLQSQIGLQQQNQNNLATIQGLKLAINQSTLIKAPITGQLVSFSATAGDAVNPGDLIATLMPTQGSLRTLVLVGSQDIGKIKVGDQAFVSPAATPAIRYGYLQGSVTALSQTPVTEKELVKAFGSDEVAQSMLQSFSAAGQLNIPYLVSITLHRNRQGQPIWTFGRQPPWGVRAGDGATVRIVASQAAPLTLLLPFLRGGL
jgi:multidrug resistance efflux pump